MYKYTSILKERENTTLDLSMISKEQDLLLLTANSYRIIAFNPITSLWQSISGKRGNNSTRVTRENAILYNLLDSYTIQAIYVLP